MSLTATVVSLTLRERTVLSEVSLDVKAGHVTALLGPNGAGKTSLVGVLAGTLVATAGSVTVDGTALASMPRAAVAKKLAVVAQELTSAPTFTVRELVMLGRAPHQGRLMLSKPRDGEIVDESMRRLGIASIAERRVGTLSGGERRRIGLARALAQDAPYLLLDEPGANLDLEGEARMFALAREEAARGRGVLIVLHGLESAARLADTIVLMAAGRVVAAGTAAEVLTKATVSKTFGVDVEIGASPIDGGLHVLPSSYRLP